MGRPCRCPPTGCQLLDAFRDRAKPAYCFNTLELTGKAKGAAQAHEPKRTWLKVKRRSSVDVVCAAVIDPITQPGAVVVGISMRRRLRIVGRSAPLSARAGRDLASHLRPPRRKHPWPEEISERVLDRFNKESGTVRLTLVEPLVVEVSGTSLGPGKRSGIQCDCFVSVRSCIRIRAAAGLSEARIVNVVYIRGRGCQRQSSIT